MSTVTISSPKKFDRRNKAYRSRFRAIALLKAITPHGYRCYICGRCYSNSSFMSLDHIVPQSNNGVEEIDNVAMACKPCNVAKGSHSLDQIAKWISNDRWEFRRSSHINGALRESNLQKESDAQIKWLPRDFSEAKSKLLTKAAACGILGEVFRRINVNSIKISSEIALLLSKDILRSSKL